MFVSLLKSERTGAMNYDEARELFRKFIVKAKRNGWSESDVREYTDSIKVLMGSDDAAAQALFPVGLYPSADAARASAVEYWRQYA